LAFSARARDQTRRWIRKGLIVLGRPRFIRAMVELRVAAATEHLWAIRFCAANTLVDVGANKGQFSLAFRAVRPKARIIAFEPLPEAADTYERLFARDELTDLQRVAISTSNGAAQFYITDRTDSSSLLRPGNDQARHHSAKTIEVPVKRLDDCVDVSRLIRPILLKVDVQGGELGVFEGCDGLPQFDFIYAELGFVEVYEGQPLFQEVSAYLAHRGFAIAGVFDQIVTAEYGPTQVDVLFKRTPRGGSTSATE
jgi:FkbM family methyltransferase